MQSLSKHFGITFAFFAMLSTMIAGCGSGEQVITQDKATESRLNEVAEIYRVYSVTYKKPPKSKTDLMKVENAAPSGMTPITSGEIEIFWGGELTDLNEEPTGPTSDKILAFEKDTPTKGGQVLLLDRSVKTMTAEEFASAPKAGTLDAAPAKKS